MQNNKSKVISLLSFIIAGTLIIPTVSFAQEEDCNRFGAKCHVSEIHTIRTTEKDTNAGLLDTIKNAINWVLGILATVTLCVCMYAGFQMLTAGADSKGYDNGLKILKNALLGLAIILLAWMIVSAVFWFVATLSGGNETMGTSLD